ncbi:MAG: hypothetical protein OXT67_03725, partial [Zetaproteobacteria bacterium]|nr:hypothetical protein [Zetaproteobacteria bacterium]
MLHVQKSLSSLAGSLTLLLSSQTALCFIPTIPVGTPPQSVWKHTLQRSLAHQSTRPVQQRTAIHMGVSNTSRQRSPYNDIIYKTYLQRMQALEAQTLDYQAFLDQHQERYDLSLAADSHFTQYNAEETPTHPIVMVSSVPEATWADLNVPPELITQLRQLNQQLQDAFLATLHAWLNLKRQITHYHGFKMNSQEILYVPISTHILAVFPQWGVILERCDSTMMAEVSHGDDLGPYA